MTDNEVIKGLKNLFNEYELDLLCTDSLEILHIAIKSIEEIQQYHSIGTVEKFKQLSEQFKAHMIDETSCQKRQCNKCDKYRKENEEYHKIGTVDECREAVERNKEKKPMIEPMAMCANGDPIFICPKCGEEVAVLDPECQEWKMDFCANCGQHLNWERDDE